MPIILPPNCRGTTAGAMRQMKQRGYTTNDRKGGAFSGEAVEAMLSASGQSTFLRHNEPLGHFMSALNQAQEEITNTTAAITEASRKMVDSAKLANDSLLDASRKMRDSTEKLGVAMTKFSGIFSSTKFAEQAKAAESLADSLERLAALEERGLLTKVMAALNPK